MKTDKTCEYRKAQARRRRAHTRAGDISSSAVVWVFVTVVAFVITVHFLKG